MFVTYGCMGIFRFGILFLWYTFWPETISLLGIWSLFVLDMTVESVILHRLFIGLKWTHRKV